jgi:PhzF family phenazine biosynthesis protein
MDFPATPVEPASVPAGLIEALGTPAKFVGKTRFDYLLELENEGCLRNLRPNFSQLAVLPVRGIIVTSRSDNPQFDFVSRFFAPAAGVNEDPVTGSAHCALGPFWQARLGRNDLTGYQASRRGGVVRVEVHGNRVMLSGHAVTIIKGELL